MKTLTLIRHSKSSWDIPIEDKLRPLSVRGIRDAHACSTKLAEILPAVNSIFCSTAKRTRDTAMIFAQYMSWPFESLYYTDKLYTFKGTELERFIRAINDTCENAILFGHNDAITDIVNKFGDQKIANVPTTGIISMRFNSNKWNDIEHGEITQVLFPRHLIYD